MNSPKPIIDQIKAREGCIKVDRLRTSFMEKMFLIKKAMKHSKGWRMDLISRKNHRFAITQLDTH